MSKKVEKNNKAELKEKNETVQESRIPVQEKQLEQVVGGISGGTETRQCQREGCWEKGIYFPSSNKFVCPKCGTYIWK